MNVLLFAATVELSERRKNAITNVSVPAENSW